MRAFHQVGVPVDELMEQIGSLVQVMRADGHLQYVNTHWLRVLGYAPHETEHLNFYKAVLHPIETEAMQTMRHTLYAGQALTDVVLSLLSKDGRPVVIEGSLIPRFADDELHSITGIFRDVTAHQEIETGLTRLFTLSSDMLSIVSFDGVFEMLNPAWQDVLGYDVDELVGRSFLDFVHPDDHQWTIAEAQRVLQGETTTRFENRYRCKDGTYKWLSWSATAYHDTAQTYCIARDITERRLTEDRLHRANEQFETILNNSGAVIYLKDAEGRYTLVNPEFERLFRVSRNDVIGKNDYDLFGTEFADAVREHDLKVYKQRSAMQFEEVLPSHDAMHTFLSTKFPLLDPDGRAYALGAISTDITFRKLTEVQLHLRNQAIEHSPWAISIADATLPDLPLIYINPAFERITGYSTLDAIGRNCRFLQRDDRQQTALDELRAALRAEQSCTVVLRNYRKDGTLFYNELSLAPIHDVNGQLTHYVGIGTDVTQRIEAESKIQTQNQELKQTNQALARARKEAEDATRLKSQFLATMSHELRTPLNAIIGYTEIQLAGMTGDLTDEQRDYQERVLANAEHLLALINDVLDIAKIEAGRLEIVNKPFNLRNWVDEVVAQNRGLAEEKSLDFIYDVDSRMPEVIVGDPARIKQIVINLVSNGIKFTTTGYIKLAIRKHGRDAWKLVVSDSGVGIPSHMQETIFEEFRQVDSSSQRKQGGTGLGLSIVRKLCLMMGGNIRVQSALGKGSIFSIILPLTEQTHAQQPVNDLGLPEPLEGSND